FLLLFNSINAASHNQNGQALAMPFTGSSNVRAERDPESGEKVLLLGAAYRNEDVSCKKVCIPLAKKMCCACVCLSGFVVTALLLVEKECDYFGNTTKED
ncbi:MAG: hypothetical protein ACJAZS_000788, partial [Alteromonas naphthalenivorans]